MDGAMFVIKLLHFLKTITLLLSNDILANEKGFSLRC